jgi:hypothetical protein
MKSEKSDARRIVLEMLAPPAIGALSFIFYQAYQANHFPPDAEDVRLCLLLGYFFGFIPSLIYTAFMERAIKRGLQPKTWRFVGFSSILGLLAGVAIATVVGTGDDELRVSDLLGSLAVDGLWTGFVLGLLLKSLAHWSDRRNPPPTALPPAKPM